VKIAVLGTGYVGLVQSVCLAELGNNVTGIDIDAEKVALLLSGKSPIFEPELEELLIRNLDEGRLNFTTDTDLGIAGATIIFIAVGTPSLPDGRADLKYVEGAAKAIGMALKAQTPPTLPVIVNKSTVPIGTGNLVERLIHESSNQSCTVLSNPEFLREGSAVHDFLHPDRVIIGGETTDAIERLKSLYAPLQTTILCTDLKTAELIKYASNALLATEISFINSIAQLAEHVGADVTHVAAGMKLDKRIGPHAFLDAGPGYGGSCFPKDVQALIRMSHDADIHFGILEATEDVNAAQRRRIIAKIRSILPNIEKTTIGVWGLAFKPKTDDMREAPALTILPALIELGTTIQAFDPVAEEQARKILPAIKYCKTPFEAAKDVDVLLILTNWDEFSAPDFAELKANMRQPIIVDGRNLYDPATMKKLGFTYLSIGRPPIHHKTF
jgi:UDPglucose 6-dehydrogenase